MKKIFSIFQRRNSVNPVESHEGVAKYKDKDYYFKIFGVDNQLIEIDLAPRQVLTVEPSSIVYIDQRISMETSIKSGTQSGVRRVLGGSSLFLIDLFNEDDKRSSKVSLSSNHFGWITWFHVEDYPEGLTFTSDSYLSSGMNVVITGEFISASMAIFQQSILMQKYNGRGIVFIKSGVNPNKIILKEQEEITVSSEALLGFSSTVSTKVSINPHIQNIVSGRNFFMLKLKGPGVVFVQNTHKNAYDSSVAKEILYSSGSLGLERALKYWGGKEESGDNEINGKEEHADSNKDVTDEGDEWVKEEGIGVEENAIDEVDGPADFIDSNCYLDYE